MLYLKAMSGQDLPDESPCKNFTLWPIPDGSALSFAKSDLKPDGVQASWFTEHGLQIVQLEGNAYVLNSNGKTIASSASFS